MSCDFPFPIFCSSFLVTFANEVTKILCNLCLHFARQDGQDRKRQKENHRTKMSKIQKTKRRKYGTMNKKQIQLYFCEIQVSINQSEQSLRLISIRIFLYGLFGSLAFATALILVKNKVRKSNFNSANFGPREKFQPPLKSFSNFGLNESNRKIKNNCSKN